MDPCVLPKECLLQVADDIAGLHMELPSSKLVRLEEKPVRPRPGRDRLFEAHRDAAFLLLSATRPRVERFSEGALLSTLGLRFNIPMTDRLP